MSSVAVSKVWKGTTPSCAARLQRSAPSKAGYSSRKAAGRTPPDAWRVTARPNPRVAREWSRIHAVNISAPPGECTFDLKSYGDVLRANKALLNSAMDKNRTSPDCRDLFMAMGMLETTLLDASQRDATKDSAGPAANVSLFNLSIDLVQQLGYKGNASDLNSTNMLPEVIGLLQKGVDQWGVDRLLNFVRGGRTGFTNPASVEKAYGLEDYRQAIRTIIQQLEADPKLRSDDRRVEVFVRHV